MPQPPESPATASSAELQIPMPTVARFVRQLSHDLRNHLNAAELQSAYLKEIAEDAEVKAEIVRLRTMLSEMGSSLQKLTALLAPAKLNEMTYDAKDFVEDLIAKVGMEFPAAAGDFEWNAEAATGVLNIDPQLLQQALLELVRNALSHGRGEGKISVAAGSSDGEFVVTITEPKSAFELPTERWGNEPFQTLKHGHYGLGLHRTRNIVEAHGGRFTAQFDPGESALVTSVAIPLRDA